MPIFLIGFIFNENSLNILKIIVLFFFGENGRVTYSLITNGKMNSILYGISLDSKTGLLSIDNLDIEMSLPQNFSFNIKAQDNGVPNSLSAKTLVY